MQRMQIATPSDFVALVIVMRDWCSTAESAEKFSPKLSYLMSPGQSMTVRSGQLLPETDRFHLDAIQKISLDR